MNEIANKSTQRNSWWRSRWIDYSLAILLPLLILLVRLVMGDVSENKPIVVLFLIPTICCAYFGGIGPGLLSTAVSAFLVDFFLIYPRHTLFIGDNLERVNWLFLVVVGVLVSVCIEALHRSRRRVSASENLQKVTLASIGDAVIATDGQGRVTFLNRMAEQLTGWGKRDAIGQPLATVFKIISEETRQPVDDPVSKVLKSGLVIGLANHTLLISKDGREIPIDDSGAPIRSDEGTIIGVVLVFRDCTDRRKAEAVMHERMVLQEQLANIVATAPGAFYSYHQRLDGSACIPFASPRISELFGVQPEEIKEDATVLFNRLDPEDVPHVKESIAESARSMNPWQDEFRVRHPQRGWLWVEGRSMPQRQPDDSIIWQGFIQDITPRKKAEAAFLDSRALYHSLVEQLPVGIYRKNADGAFVYVNSYFCDLHHLSEEDYLGRKISEIPNNGETSKAEAEAQHNEIMRTGRRIEVDEAWPGQDGKVRWLHAVKVPVRDADQNIVGSLGIVMDVTQVKEAEIALRESQNLYHSLVEQLPVGVYRKDLEGRFIFVNSYNCKLHQLDRKDFIGRKMSEIPIGGSVLKQLGDQYHKEIIQNGKHVQLDEAWPQENGKNLWLRAYKSPVSDVDGKIIGTQGLVFDVTQIKEAEIALRESQILYHSLVEQLPVGVYRKDLAGRYVFVNPYFAGLHNIPPDFFIGRRACEIPISDVPFLVNVEHQHQEVITSGRKIESVEEWNRPDGKKSVHHCIRTPVFDADGNIVGSQGLVVNITGTREVEESNQRLAAAVEQAVEDIMITGPDATILYVNPAFERVTGYTRQEVVGQKPNLLKSGKHDAAFYRGMWQTLLRGDVWSGRVTNRKKDGATVEEEATISPIRDANGKIVSYVAVRRDVTREIALEAQLRHSQKMDAIGQLAGGVAHDFNNLLTVIRGNVALMQLQGILSTEQNAGLIEIAKAADRATSLTRQLLLFSRQENIQASDLDLNDIVTNLTKMLRRVLGEDIQVQLKFAPYPLMVHADAGMMDQILMNLAVNSRDAMPNGGKLVIETSAVEFDETTAAQSVRAVAGSFVCLSVSDTGCGIAPEIMPRIFDPFFTTKEIGKGTGLGLATVFGIVKQHNGWISPYSKPGNGTTFRIYLPRLKKAKNPNVVSSRNAPMPRGSEGILLVEDEEPVRRLMHKVLSRLGYQIFQAPSGVAALEVWKQHKNEIQLLLTDLVMPEGLNGKNLAEKLLHENPHLKVVYASGYSADIADDDLTLQEGVNFLAKPFEAHKLAQTVRNMLNH